VRSCRIYAEVRLGIKPLTLLNQNLQFRTGYRAWREVITLYVKIAQQARAALYPARQQKSNCRENYMRLVALFMVFVVAAGSFGQSCERTLPVAVGLPGSAPQRFEAKDFAAAVNRQDIPVTKVEPIRQIRLLILLPADYLARIKEKKDFQYQIARLSEIDGIPENVSIAYGVYAEKIAFSEHFTSDAQELRSSLRTLVSKAESGALGRESPLFDCLMNPVFDFLGTPQPGDTLVRFGSGPTFCAPGHKKDDWDFNLGIVARYFSENSLQEFSLHSYGEKWSYSWGAARVVKSTWQEVEDFLLTGITKGYMVTVAVPESLKNGKGTWTMTLSADARAHFGFPPKGKILMAFPNLLLCGTDKNGAPQFASQDGQFP
jgi:hypothetical protein